MKQEYVEVPVLLRTDYIFQYLYSNIYVLSPLVWIEQPEHGDSISLWNAGNSLPKFNESYPSKQ